MSDDPATLTACLSHTVTGRVHCCGAGAWRHHVQRQRPRRVCAPAHRRICLSGARCFLFGSGVFLQAPVSSCSRTRMTCTSPCSPDTVPPTLGHGATSLDTQQHVFEISHLTRESWYRVPVGRVGVNPEQVCAEGRSQPYALSAGVQMRRTFLCQ